MKPVEQTEMRPGGGGNCVAACVASLFELPLKDCYPAIPLGGGFQFVYDWTKARYPALVACQQDYGHLERNHYVRDYKPIEVVEAPFIPHGYWMATAISPRGIIDEHGRPSLHAVVMHGRDVAWDPHPKRDMGIGPIAGATWWVVRDPAML